MAHLWGKEKLLNDKKQVISMEKEMNMDPHYTSKS